MIKNESPYVVNTGAARAVGPTLHPSKKSHQAGIFSDICCVEYFIVIELAGTNKN